MRVMKSKKAWLSILSLTLGIWNSSKAIFPAPAGRRLETVTHVDLGRYIGKWYEIARYPNRFEKSCDRSVAAEYATQPNGKISVLNSCLRPDGKEKKSKGTAKVVDKSTNAKLSVTFWWPFSGKYWVIDLGSNYEYAVVGEPSRKYLWILSRAASMPEDKYREITAGLAAKGYDASKLVRTKQ